MTNEELWKAVLGEMELSLSRANFTTWFKNTCVLSKDKNAIVVSVPNGFIKEWLENKFNKRILDSVRNQTPEIREIRYIIGRPKIELAKHDFSNVLLERELESRSDNETDKDVDGSTNLNKKYTFYPELVRMVAKSTGIGQKLRKLKKKLGELNYVMFSGEFVNGKAARHGQVDVLVIGEVVLAELAQLVKEQQEKLGREINYTVLPLAEFEFRKTRRDPFIMDVLYGTHVMVIGSEEEFCKREIPGL